jgi:hypothetical protein
MGQLRTVILSASYTKFPIVVVSKIGSELYVISGFRREVYEIGPLWVITQRIVVIPYRRFGTTYRSNFQRSINF